MFHNMTNTWHICEVSRKQNSREMARSLFSTDIVVNFQHRKYSHDINTIQQITVLKLLRGYTCADPDGRGAGGRIPHAHTPLKNHKNIRFLS